ncbi:GNAT family N-acetyltransferase [Hymenobacter taeanensis]|uniref:GNAT family N-acetyltransferase n=1 Tax=Hymenobacter taeanensis TaxID=2735321 RepID=A0A6M6BEX9_9BACT|nr:MULTISPECIES: GNAT family N-acetyltransferase [Hymenobacter]QJX46304.1 GNAT family N-acetyltransferase [Hymenobacter taeanensis]UOQ80162.1 GNAT family N-acetyltransferase [Hymenobacter sp. 5414T-23]
MASIISPRTPAEWEAYYHLRYSVLRQPWGQPAGSERAEDDAAPTTTHALLLAPDGQALGVGRLHPSGPQQGQVRFMAVQAQTQGQGVGRQVLEHLEAAARQQGLTEIVLHAREQAVPFYERLGYTVVAPSHTLFGTVPHFLMRKVVVA